MQLSYSNCWYCSDSCSYLCLRPYWLAPTSPLLLYLYCLEHLNKYIEWVQINWHAILPDANSVGTSSAWWQNDSIYIKHQNISASSSIRFNRGSNCSAHNTCFYLNHLMTFFIYRLVNAPFLVGAAANFSNGNTSNRHYLKNFVHSPLWFLSYSMSMQTHYKNFYALLFYIVENIMALKALI